MKISIFTLFVLCSAAASAQVIYTPGGTVGTSSNSWVGVGTSSPGATLDVVGTLRTTGEITGGERIGASVSSNEGGSVRISNPLKNSAEKTRDWVIWNMTNGYGDALRFWRYEGDGSNGGPSLTLWDNGDASLVGNLFVDGAIQGAGRKRVAIVRSIGGSTGDTVAIGAFSNDGRGHSVTVSLKAHNGSVIDVHTYRVAMPAYLGNTTNWLELPISETASSYSGAAGYAIDVYRPNINSTTDSLYLRVRVKRTLSAGTVYLNLDYDTASTLTESLASGSTGAAFDASSAPASGAVDGYHGALEWVFPVSPSVGWGNAGSEGLFVRNSGNVGIGTLNPGYKLAVNGTIRAKEVIVDTGWADYVFAKDYKLAPLAEVKAQIAANRCLPGVPSAEEISKKGVSIGTMQAILLAKIEELTLHQIAQAEEMQSLRRRVADQDHEIQALRGGRSP